jgi:arylsulfatase A-like enzyme
MLHVYGTHAPYYSTPALSPFQPATQTPSWETLEALYNQYKNAIVTQDAELARAVRAFVSSRSGPWLVLFTSDHGEAFGEHHAIHHGQNLYDEQIHVPGFIAFGSGALTASEERTLRERARGPSSHLDVLPTLLDVLGVWDAFPLLPYNNRMLGSSLLRSAPERPRAIPMTNCTTSAPCPMNTWGMLGERHALVAQVWDASFKCVPLDDSGTVIEDGIECSWLRGRSRQFFPTLPNGNPNH